MADLNKPPLKSALPIDGRFASWPQPWGNFLTGLWERINYGWFWQVRTVAANYTCIATDSVILLNADVTVTLPAVAQGARKRISVKVINAGGGTRTVSGGSANIDGAGTVTTTTQYTSWDFVCNGTQWFVL